MRNNGWPPSPCVSPTRVKQRADTDRWSPEGERRSPSEDEGDEKPSAAAEIYSAEDHQEIFHPRKVLRRCRSAAAASVPLKCPAAVNQQHNHSSAPFPHQLARRPGCQSRFLLLLKTVSLEAGSRKRECCLDTHLSFSSSTPSSQRAAQPLAASQRRSPLPSLKSTWSVKAEMHLSGVNVLHTARRVKQEVN